MIDIQNDLANSDCPNDNWFIDVGSNIVKFLIKQDIIRSEQAGADLLIRIVGTDESNNLNKVYRNQDKATNILAFSGINLADFPPKLQAKLAPQLGELVICFEVAQAEAKEQGISIYHHLSHLITHGILHLLGYGHQTDKQAQIMEDLEAKVISKIENKY